MDAGQRGEDLAHIAGPHSGGAGVVHGLADIEAVAVEVHLAGVAVGDGDVGGLGCPQQTGLQVIQVADAVAAAQVHADLIDGGGGGVVALGDHEGIHAQLHHVHHGVNTGHVGGVHLLVQAVVDIGVLEDGGLGPVAVEAQEGHGQRRIVVVGQLHEALHIDAVGELGQIRPVRVGQADGDGDGGLAVSGHGDGGAAEGAAGDLDGAGVGGEDIALLGDVQPVGGGALGLDGGADVIGQGGAGEVLHHEAQLVHAQLVGVVAQLDLGLVLAPDIQVGGGGDGLGQVHHTGALLAGRVSHAVFIIQDVGGAHQQAVHQQLLVGIGGAGHQGVDILQSGGGHTRQIRRRHGGTAHVAVLGEGQRGIDAAAGGGDLRLQGQRRQGAPGGEVAHGHGALFGLGDGEGLFLGGFHHLAVGQADAHGGDLVVIHGHVQQIAVAVVIDDAARSTGRGGIELLLLEGQAAAHDHGDLAGDVQALVIGGVAGVGHHDVFIGPGAVIAQQQGGEVVAGHVLIGDAALGGDKGRRLVGVDGGNGQRRVIGGRGADDAGVGVGHGGEVTLCAALGGGIGVTGGAVQQDTGGLDQVVILGGQVALGLPAEAAVGAERHVDHVHVQQQGIVQGRQDGIRGGAVGGVGEYLEDGQLGLGRLTGEGDAAVGVHGLAGGDTGHVGAVVIAVLLHGVGGGDHVRVGVGIVEGEGHLAALIQVVLGQQHQGAGAVLLGIPEGGIAVGGDVGLAVLPFAEGIQQLAEAGLLQLLHGRSVGKGLVVHIQTGVQDADEHPLALILGVVGVGRHFRGGQGLAQSGGAHGIGVVGLAQHHVLYAADVLDVMDLAVRHLGGKAADHGGVAEGEGAGNALAFHGVHHGELQVGDVLQLGLGCVRLLEVQHGHTGIGAVADIQQAVCIQLHNDTDHFVVRRDLGPGHLIGVHVLLEDRQTVAVCELIGHIGGRQPGLGVRRRQFRRHGADRQDADEHHQHQDQGQQPLRHSRLFHRSTSFLNFFVPLPCCVEEFPDCIIILPFSCKSKEFLPKTRIFSGNVSGVSAGWTAGWRFFPMLRYHITVINDPLFFVLISRTVSWLCVRVGQIRQNVSLPFSAPLIPSTIHAHLCLFVPGGRQRKLLEISSMNILYIFQHSSNISTLQGRFDQMLRRGVSTKGRKKPPLPRERRQSLSKKPRRVCRPQAANKVQSVFCGGVYVAKNTSRSASVEFVRFQRTNYARGRLQAFCQKRATPFFDKLSRRSDAGAAADIHFTWRPWDQTAVMLWRWSI